MKYIKLSNEQGLEIKTKLEELLAPINGKVEIDMEPALIHSWKSSDNGKSEWDEYWYTIAVKSDKGSCEVEESFLNGPAMKDHIWNLAYMVWVKLDGNIKSNLAEHIWGAGRHD